MTATNQHRKCDTPSSVPVNRFFSIYVCLLFVNLLTDLYIDVHTEAYRVVWMRRANT